MSSRINVLFLQYTSTLHHSAHPVLLCDKIIRAPVSVMSPEQKGMVSTQIIRITYRPQDRMRKSPEAEIFWDMVS